MAYKYDSYFYLQKGKCQKNAKSQHGIPAWQGEKNHLNYVISTLSSLNPTQLLFLPFQTTWLMGALKNLEKVNCFISDVSLLVVSLGWRFQEISQWRWVSGPSATWLDKKKIFSLFFTKNAIINTFTQTIVWYVSAFMISLSG